ncbi:MAG: hypothetical protein FD131_3737 [Rhodocyclaceae bacterium]|nr:MAG: hypothetical protein FD131_3737 [Rhodocyclaceae bacterium]
MRIALAPILAGIAFLTLTACTSVPSVSEIPASIANATTTAEHQRIAAYFAEKAASYDAEAAWHEKMALSYAGRPKGDLAAMMAHCRSLKEQFTNAARDARTLEQAHRQLAGSLGK